MKRQYIALLLALSVVGVSAGAQIYVDDNAPNDPAPYYSKGSDTHEDGSAEHPFDDVQEAIDAAVDGDTIVVAPGRYLSLDKWEYDEITFDGKNIRLMGSAPTDFTVIDQTVLCGVVVFDGTESSDCLLQGFKIQNHAHGGILGNGTQAQISHCIISGNGPCGATVLKDVQGPIRNCLIVDNTTFHDCGVLPVVSGCAEFVNCTIANNLSGLDMGTTKATVRNCIIYGNQGSQMIGTTVSRGASPLPVSYSLIGNWQNSSDGNMDTDPCLVRLGSWVERSVATRTGRTKVLVLVEGDYHLKTEGWRWSPQPVHGSNWYFDEVTSPAVDAGDPIDGLGEELERAPDDPEGLWGVNHAIDLGAYGGTTQASLAPTDGETPGIAAVDLRDYWPLTTGDNRWYATNPDGTTRCLCVSSGVYEGTGLTYYLTITRASDWVARIYCYYVGRTVYMTEQAAGTSLWTEPPEQIQAQYPLFPMAGSTMEIPFDPFLKGTVEYRSVVVTRGSLADVLAGTSIDPSLILEGSWPDVIAFKEISEDGTTGDPIAIFARGVGPLMIAGRIINGAIINYRTFGTIPATTATRGG